MAMKGHKAGGGIQSRQHVERFEHRVRPDDGVEYRATILFV
jgi:hypothetical protein